MDVYCGQKFKLVNLPTIDIELIEIKVKMKDGNEVIVKLYDTAGQERFHSMSISILGNSDGAAIFYDISNRRSFEGIENWYQDIRKYGEMPVILIA